MNSHTINSHATNTHAMNSSAIKRIALGLVTVLAMASAQAQAATSESRVTVLGYGEEKVSADRAALSLTISQNGANVTDIEQQISRQVSDVINALTALNIGMQDIDSTGIRISPRSRYDQVSKRSVDDGFHAQRQIDVTLKDLSQLGAVIQRVTALGVNRVAQPRLYSSEHEEAYLKALRTAVAQAKNRAAVIADASGTELGGIYQINVAGNNPPLPVGNARIAMAADIESNNFNPGELTVRATVTATFNLIAR